MRLKSRIDSIEKRLDQKHVQVWDETEYQRLSAVLQRGLDDPARDPASEAIYGVEFLEAAEWIWTASTAAGRCTESEMFAAAENLRVRINAA